MSRTATAAVLAAMADNIWSDLKRQKENAQAFDEEFDRELKPYTLRTADKIRIKELAAKRGTTVSIVVREAIDRFLEEEQAKEVA